MTTRTDNASVAIIGAGMAGLGCARTLRDAGMDPVIFEKSRGIGGRAATRRAEVLRFDHGAQYVTARGAAFRAYLESAAAAGAAAVWPGAGEGRMVGLPGMNGLARPLAQGLDIRFSTEIAEIRPDPAGGWRLETAAGPVAQRFARVVCTAPAPQAARLCPGFSDALSAVEMAPCWALMVAVAAPLRHLPDAERLEAGPLAFVARDASKPGRDVTPETWVIHARPEWSRENLELERDVAQARLLELFAAHCGESPRVVHAAAHRWRYAMTTSPLGRPFLASEDGTLLAGGDWALGARVEAAFDSGLAMAEAILKPLQPS